jgi:hypothetical protein
MEEIEWHCREVEGGLPRDTESKWEISDKDLQHTPRVQKDWPCNLSTDRKYFLNELYGNHPMARHTEIAVVDQSLDDLAVKSPNGRLSSLQAS